MPQDEESLNRTGVMIGSGIGGLQTIYETSLILKERGPRRVSPFFIPSALINLVYGGNTPILGQRELAEMGYAMVLYANAALQGAVIGMQRVLGHIREQGSIDGVLEQVATFAERQRLVDKPHYDALERRYAID